MANPHLNTPSPNAQPNRWYHEGMWREVLSPHDEIGAGRARHALAAEGLYPTRDLAGDPGLAVMEANHRAALHQDRRRAGAHRPDGRLQPGAAAAVGAARAGVIRVDRGQHAGQLALLGGARGAASGGVGGVTIEYDVWVKWPQTIISGQGDGIERQSPTSK